MARREYIAIAEPGTSNWSISFPAFPGVVSVGDTFAEMVDHGRDALASAVDAMQEDGVELPPGFLDAKYADYDRSGYTDPHVLVLSVELGDRAQRINVTMDATLLTRLDRLADRTNTTRSALLAEGARLVLHASGQA